ncbi:putative Choline Transporter-like (CTL) Family Protein [Monocercomonoides exilis]|uniref:putative Choline Transporter-like (CTL) Family Protein n=1 Tax=Monocercomonoides exilis TaxID=2049356 RepID=UPI00355ABABF|nr:putative Choline Transporter-like (CTL) Family Protein [Monocercomonoides exilis]|eukprot:MONOS_8928.1-p1 / transcript=MONOS_8928.1 / gene=MONOS_8928 / organism=Monocercomonoides_exilis_PA203 / gene_product=Choline Transporter-like (CTL) Family Protein / transcript_product=Choline Transporter-like (CTL) Family Protein / location=Mono_scaffold00351:46196-47938(-) / protein_length=581 / sequence_SO=supercontig / SO=protein_coding / is_pseudo=false
MIAIGGVISIALSLIWLFCMCLCTKKVMYCCIGFALSILPIFGLICGIAGLFLYYSSSNRELSAFKLMVFAGFIMFVIGLIFLFCLYSCRRRIALVVQLTEEAGIALKAMPCVFGVSVVAVVAIGGITYLFVLCVMDFLSSFQINYSNNSMSYEIYVPSYGVVIFIFLIIAWIWMAMFVIGSNQMVVSGSVASWYFLHNKAELASWPVFNAVKRTFRYHTGSIAFGSGLIVLATILRVLSEIASSCSRSAGSSVVQFLCVCISCVLQCASRYFEYFSSGAYTLVSIKGLPFWEAGKQTILLKLRNLLQTLVLDRVLSFVFGIAEFFIDVFSFVLLILVVRPDIFNPSNVTSGNNFIPYYSWVVILVMGFLFIGVVTHVMFSTFRYGVETLYVSFLLDEEMTLSTPEYQPFPSKKLEKHMSKAAREGYSMASEYHDKNPDFNLTYWAEPPQPVVLSSVQPNQRRQEQNGNVAQLQIASQPALSSLQPQAGTDLAYAAQPPIIQYPPLVVDPIYALPAQGYEQQYPQPPPYPPAFPVQLDSNEQIPPLYEGQVQNNVQGMQPIIASAPQTLDGDKEGADVLK